MKALDRNLIKVGNEYLFNDLYDGQYDCDDLLLSGSIALWDYDLEDEVIVSFDILSRDVLDPSKSLIIVTDIEMS